MPTSYQPRPLAFLQPPPFVGELEPVEPMPTGPILVGELEKPSAFPYPDGSTTFARTLASDEMTQPINGIRDNIAIAAHVDGEPVAVALDAIITATTGMQSLPVIGSVLGTRGVVDTRRSLLGQQPIGPQTNQLVIERVERPAPQIDASSLDVFDSEPAPVTYTSSRKKWAIIAAAAGIGAFFLLRGK